MDYLPISFDLRGKPVAVVGGGTVAARKAGTALRAGAQVTVYARALEAAFEPLRGDEHLHHAGRTPAVEDLAGCALVFCATADAATNGEIAALARSARVPVNVADAPSLCDFIMPAIVDRSPLVIAVSTGGAAPLFARLIRAQLERTFATGYGRVLELAGSFRDKVAQHLPAGAARRRFWESVAEGVIVERVLRGDIEGARAEIGRLLEAAAAGVAAAPSGEVWLVGAGSGDPELLTLRALRLMQRADVVVHDPQVPDAILDLVRRDAERIDAGLPQDLVALLIGLAREGQRVLRLTMSDPAAQGDADTLRARLGAEGLALEVVPAVAPAG